MASVNERLDQLEAVTNKLKILVNTQGLKINDWQANDTAMNAQVELALSTAVAASATATEAHDTAGTALDRTHLTYSNTTRPEANTLPAGTAIFNTDDNAPNWTDGAAWRDANGELT
jgi:hypothetical protein